MSSSPNLNESDITQQLEAALSGMSAADLERAAGSGAAPAPPRGQAGHEEPGRIRGVVIDVRGADVFVNIGGKSEGIVPLDEFNPDSPPRMGQVVELISHGLDPNSGLMRLSFRASKVDGDLSKLKIGEIVKAKVTGTNIGGLELRVQGVRGFMPMSQVDLVRHDDFNHFLNHWLECEVVEVNRRGKNVVLSRRRVLEKEREASRGQVLATLEVGQVRPGKVMRLTEFGAFVDIGGVEGLLHVSDISYARVENAGAVLKEGQDIQVKVLKLDPERGRISLGIKQLAPDPWEAAANKYRPGETVNGRVTKLMNFGAFVELEPGIEGLIPVSEMSWTQRVLHPKDVVKVGDEVRVAVQNADMQARKIGLSLKALASDPWQTAAERYTPESKVSGVVMRLSDFGAFVQLEEGVEGLIHVSQLSDKRVRHPSDVLKPGQVIEARVLNVDVAQRRIGLSLKPPGSGEAGQSAAGAAAAPAAPPKKRKKPLRGGLD